ncbi:hypothetical protein PNQ20_03825 [Halobacterium salinarum]|nr:hypothetical protein [Halobacterium salinarum]MDL0135981.1 hypothetical protein [Halobacterium salinarum]
MGYSHSSGHLTLFVVQFEGDEWAIVVRSDHDPEREHGYDVAKKGVYLDVYRDEEKYRSEELFPPMQPSEALTYAKDQIPMQPEGYSTRFEEWHEIRTQ